MKNTDNRSKLIQILADGEFHSGERLGQALGISRAAIGKHIQALSEIGLDIFKVTGKGYKLTHPICLLNADIIKRELPESFPLEVLNIIESTNDHVKAQFRQQSSGYTVLAEAQTAGRGRHGRTWVSPFGASLYMSTYWRFEDGYQAAAGLSLAVGVAIARALKNLLGLSVSLKWPNDVYYNANKLAGVLIEVEGQFGAACDCVVGVGLNVNLPDELPEISQPFIDLKTATEERIVDRNHLSAALIKHMYQTLVEFEKTGLSSFIEEWRELDLYDNKPVKLISGEQVTIGIGRGINDSGGFLVEIDGAVKAHYGGEISVRAVD